MLPDILKNKNISEFYFSGKSPGIMAYHGGAIEKGTEQIARALISHGFAGYILSARNCGFLSAPSPRSRASARSCCFLSDTKCQTFRTSARTDNAYKNFHIGSTHIKPDDSEKLSKFIRTVDTAIAVHGQARDENIYVGGLNEILRVKIAKELSSEFPGEVISDPKKIPANLSGTSEKNIVNVPKNNGVQIELPKSLRQMGEDYGACAKDENSKKICNAILSAILV